MRDQAAAWRALTSRAGAATTPKPKGPPTIVIGSGRGGVGKSLSAVVVADSLATLGHRVLLLDGDQNLATLHMLLRVTPRGRLSDLVNGEGVADALLTPVRERLWLLPGDSGAEALYGMGPIAQARLHARLGHLAETFDVVVVDAASGLEGAVRASTMQASQLVVVAVPEPAALAGAYALIKTAHAQACSAGLSVIINRVLPSDDGAAAFQRLQLAAERFLRLPLRFLGAVPEDGAVRATLRGGGPFPGDAEQGPAVRALRAIAGQLAPGAPVEAAS